MGDAVQPLRALSNHCRFSISLPTSHHLLGPRPLFPIHPWPEAFGQWVAPLLVGVQPHFSGGKQSFFCRRDVVRGRTETVPSNSRPRHWCFAGRSGSAAARERDCSERTSDVFRYHIGPTVFAIHPRRSNSACQQSRSNPPPGVRADGEELKALGELRSYITRIRKPSRLHVHLYWAFFNTSSALVFEWPIAMGRTD